MTSKSKSKCKCKIVTYDLTLLYSDDEFIDKFNSKCNIDSKCYIDYKGLLNEVSCPNMISNTGYVGDLFWVFALSITFLFVVIWLSSYAKSSM